MKKFFLISLLLGASTAMAAETVEFHIAAGTDDKPWNTEETKLVLKVGDTLKIVNDDTIVHQLHTNGRPFPHGNPIQPGTTAEYLTRRSYNVERDDFIYDHGFGQDATFFLEVDEATSDDNNDGT